MQAGLGTIVDRNSGAQPDLLAAPVPRSWLVLANLCAALVASALQVAAIEDVRVGSRHPPRADVLVPRDCPRGCIWPVSTTTPEDRERFFGQSGTDRVHVVEADWLGRIQPCRLYAYRLPTAAFRPDEVGGYWVADEVVEAKERVMVDDLLGAHAAARIELRVTPSIWPFWQRVTRSTVEFSGSRLHNATPDRPGTN
jgi:hypothetical protein